ncbi:MAG: SURF1 family protein [Pseudomonadota bacterium]
MSDKVTAHRPLWVDLTVLLISFAVFFTLLALGTWQLHRLEWKTDLIEAVESRAFGAPVRPPAGKVMESDHAFLRVVVDGIYRHDLSRRVKAVTDVGPGYWLLTPLRSGRSHIWVNRGFVPTGPPDQDLTKPAGTVRIEGLLRVTEPDGTLLERNDPSRGRWVSRDVSALSQDVDITNAAAYFIDADHAGRSASWPRGGMTVTTFRNPHLAYSLTWFAMAGLLFFGIAYVIRDRWRSEKR